MTARALIIAIEQYPRVTGGSLAGTLDGTLQAGLDVEGWLRAKWRRDGIADADTEVIFCSEPRQPHGRGATRQDIVDALLDLRQSGARMTHELFVFFSGHGFAFTDPVRGRADFLISSDFASPDRSAPCCLKLDGIVAWLREHLGPGRHFYFVDACRNLLDPTVILPPDLGLPPHNASLDEPTTFVLQSTTPGAVAAVGSAFPLALLEGLAGRGAAKTYDPSRLDAMVVHYGSLRAFVKAALPQQMVTSRVDGTATEPEAILATLRPIPTVACTIVVDDLPGRAATVRLRRGRGAVEAHALHGSTLALALEPDFYAIAVEIDGFAVEPSGFVQRAIYEEETLAFACTGPLGLAGVLGAAPALDQAAPDLPSMPAGEAFAAGPDTGPPWAGDPTREAIAARFPRIAGRVDLSESLHGHPIEADLDLWLAVIAGGAALNGRPAGDFHKIAQLGLHDFRDEPPGSAPIFVLAGLPPGARLEVAVGRTFDDTPWLDAGAVAGPPGLFEAYQSAAAGQRFVSFRVDGGTPATVAAFGLPDRATVFTLVVDDDGDLRPMPFLIPIGAGIDRLPPAARTTVTGRPNMLLDVYQQAVAVRAFRHRRPLAGALDVAVHADLRAGAWLDPLGPILVGFDLLRRGDAGAALAVADAIGRIAPELPDVAALATLAGRPMPIAGLPLVLDGLRGLPADALRRSMPLALLDERGPWTLCRGAVR